MNDEQLKALAETISEQAWTGLADLHEDINRLKKTRIATCDHDENVIRIALNTVSGTLYLRSYERDNMEPEEKSQT